MKIIKITNEMYLRAFKEARERGILKHSLTNGNGNITGTLAEECFHVLFPSAIKCLDYDKDFMYNGIAVDVKGRKLNSLILDPSKNEMVVKIVKKQLKNDYFYFFGISELRMEGYAYGWMEKERFLSCDKVEKGSPRINPSGGVYLSNGYRVNFKDLEENI